MATDPTTPIGRAEAGHMEIAGMETAIQIRTGRITPAELVHHRIPLFQILRNESFGELSGMTTTTTTAMRTYQTSVALHLRLPQQSRSSLLNSLLIMHCDTRRAGLTMEIWVLQFSFNYAEKMGSG
jgi:hypothetical protein